MSDAILRYVFDCDIRLKLKSSSLSLSLSSSLKSLTTTLLVCLITCEIPIQSSKIVLGIVNVKHRLTREYIGGEEPPIYSLGLPGGKDQDRHCNTV